MPLELAKLYTHLPVAMLVVFRMAGMMLTAPLFSSVAVPARVRVWLTVTMAAVVMPIVWSTLPTQLTLHRAVTGLVGELLLGMLIGLVFSLLFVGMQIGGLMIGRQAGLAMAQAFNPAINSEDTILGQFYFLVATAVFLVMNGHHILINALVQSFTSVPVLSFAAGPNVVVAVAGGLAEAFTVGVRLAGPVLIALFLSSISLNFVAKTMPQLNILVVGFPLRVMVALLIAAAAIHGVGDLMLDGLSETAALLEALLR